MTLIQLNCVYLKKNGKLFAAFMDTEKAKYRVEKKGLWDVLNTNGVEGQLLEGIK